MSNLVGKPKGRISHNAVRFVGPLWRYTECETSDVMPAEGCLTHVRKHCISKTHLVTKILRTTLDNYENILTKHESVILVQLFRDPRAIINSRSRTWWYSYASDKALEDDADCLCSQMMLDYEYGLAFQAKFPGRMLSLIYEDFMSDLHSKLDRLYEKLGMSTLDNLEMIINDLLKQISDAGMSYSSKPKNLKAKKDTEWWRSSLSWQQIQIIDKQCQDVYKVIGYRTFENQEELNDMNSSSFRIKEHLKL